MRNFFSRKISSNSEVLHVVLCCSVVSDERVRPDDVT